MVCKHAVVAAFRIYAHRGEVAAKRGGWSLVMEITLLIIENHGIVFLNFCGNHVKFLLLFSSICATGFQACPTFPHFLICS